MTKRRVPGETVEWHMGVPEDNCLLGDVGECGLIVPDRAVDENELVVIARGAMAERHRPETVNIKRDPQWHARQPVPVRARSSQRTR